MKMTFLGVVLLGMIFTNGCQRNNNSLEYLCRGLEYWIGEEVGHPENPPWDEPWDHRLELSVDLGTGKVIHMMEFIEGAKKFDGPAFAGRSYTDDLEILAVVSDAEVTVVIDEPGLFHRTRIDRIRREYQILQEDSDRRFAAYDVQAIGVCVTR